MATLPYTVNPDDPTQPVEALSLGAAAAELRAIKSRVITARQETAELGEQVLKHEGAEPYELDARLNANGFKITELPTAESAQDAVPLQQVEQLVAASVRAYTQITWAPGLAVQVSPTRNWTVQGVTAYAATAAHIASDSFNDDLAAGLWVNLDTLQLFTEFAATGGAARVGADDGDGGARWTTTQGAINHFDIYVKQQVAVAENYASLQDALNSGAPIVRMTEAHSLSAGLTLPAGVAFESNGKASTAITCSANITPITMSSVNDAALEGVLIIAHSTQTNPLILLDAAAATMARCRVRDVQGSGAATDFPFISIRTRNGAYGSWAHEISDVSVSGCGTIIKAETQFADSWINSLKVSHVHANDYIRGLHAIATAGDGCSDSTFLDWATQTSARTQFGALIADVGTQGQSRGNSFTDCRFYDLSGGAFGYYIGENVLDTRVQGLIVDPLTSTRFVDHGIGTTVNGMTPMDYLCRRGRGAIIPTNTGLSSALGATGSVQTTPTFSNTRTGSTVNSTAHLYSTDAVASLAQNNVFNTDFGLPFRFSFVVSRIGSSAASVGRVQFKRTQADGPLAAPGIGLQISNLSMFGESYGSSGATVDLGTMMVDGQSYRVDAFVYPGSRVEWWVNGVWKATQSTAANVPSGSGACYYGQYLTNGTATDIQMLVSNISVRAGE